jgi:hypothetical protein
MNAILFSFLLLSFSIAEILKEEFDALTAIFARGCSSCLIVQTAVCPQNSNFVSCTTSDPQRVMKLYVLCARRVCVHCALQKTGGQELDVACIRIGIAHCIDFIVRM